MTWCEGPLDGGGFGKVPFVCDAKWTLKMYGSSRKVMSERGISSHISRRRS
jgi:hypothetical protein